MQYFLVRPLFRQSLRTSALTIVYKFLMFAVVIGSLFQTTVLRAQDTESPESARPALRGSLVEDRAARKLIDAG